MTSHQNNQTLDQMLSDYAVIRSAGTAALTGITLAGTTSQPYFEEDPHGDDHSLETGWELLTGFTCQYGYSGPGMHSSEYVGGGLAQHILDTPGLYTVLYGDDAWYVAHKPEHAPTQEDQATRSQVANRGITLDAEHVPAPEPAEHAYQISLDGESVRQEIEDAYQHGNNPHGHTLDEVEFLTGVTDTEIGEIINNNVSDDFWQAYDSARHDVIETLTTTLRQEKGD